jgi:hypothetical protein
MRSETLLFFFNLLNNKEMYIIHNKTRQTSSNIDGHWPLDYLEKMLEKGDRIIVISLYSNTIKVPYHVDYNGVKEWEWENFPLLKSY